MADFMFLDYASEYLSFRSFLFLVAGFKFGGYSKNIDFGWYDGETLVVYLLENYNVYDAGDFNGLAVGNTAPSKTPLYNDACLVLNRFVE